MTVRLAERLPGRDNNLNLLRMIAALTVLVSHSVPIATGNSAGEPVLAWTGEGAAGYAVALFFSLSGLLIARSRDRHAGHARFLLARFLRIYPGLSVVLVLTVLAGAAVTSLSLREYAVHPMTLAYLPTNLTLWTLQYDLPGVFTDNPYGPATNGSLWTLFYEVTCYAAVFLAGLLAFFRHRVIFSLLLLVAMAVQAITADYQIGGPHALRVELLSKLAYPFALGVFAYLWRDRLVLSAPLAGGVLAVALVLPAVTGPVLLVPVVIKLCLAYAALVFGYARTPRLRAYNRLGDYSYGTYIYAFPVQQLAVWALPDQSPLQNASIALVPTLCLAVMSWHLIERPALAMVDRLSAAFDRKGYRVRTS